MPDGDQGQAREIAVFRHNLFRISEPFITQQAQALTRYKPFYLGRMRYGAAPVGAVTIASSSEKSVAHCSASAVPRCRPSRTARAAARCIWHRCRPSRRSGSCRG